MAKKKSSGFKGPIRNRGEGVGTAARPSNAPYDYSPDYTAENRPIKRSEIRDIYSKMYENMQQRDQRSLDRIRSAESEFYAGIDPRRRQEVADAGMIQEDHGAIANLSPRAIHREYPKAGYYSTQYIDDLERGGRFFSDDNDTLL